MKRALIVAGIVVVAIPAAAIGAAAWFLNGDAVKARLIEQVRRGTGRDLTISGPVSLVWSLSPTIALSDLSLSNPPGFIRPQMAHVDRLEVQLALAPLFHREIDIRRIAIVSPSVQLERDTAGHPNWDLRPPPVPTRSLRHTGANRWRSLPARGRNRRYRWCDDHLWRPDCHRAPCRL